MPWLTPIDGGAPQEIPNELLQKAIDSGLYEAPTGPIPVTTRVGPGQVSAEEFGLVRDIASPEPEAGFRARERTTRLEREHGGAIGAIGAGLTAGVDTLGFGLPGAIVKNVSPDTYENLKEGQEVHPVAAGIGTGAAMIAPAFLSGGTSAAAQALRLTPMGISARVGAGLARTAEGASAITKIGRTALGGAAEFGLQGLGAGAQELVAADDDVTVQRALSTLSSHALFGVGVGGLGSALIKSVEIGIVKGASMARNAAKERMAAQSISDDVSKLDRAGVKTARDAHLDELDAAQRSERAVAKQEAVGKLDAHRTSVDDSGAWLIVDGTDAKRLMDAKKTIRRALDNPKWLAKNPSYMGKALGVEETALEGVMKNAPDILERLAAEDSALARLERATLPDNAESVVFQGRSAKRYGQFDPEVRAVGRGDAAEVTVPRERARSFLDALESGELQGRRAAALENVPELLARNRALQAELEATALPLIGRSELRSPRLAELASHEDALIEGAKRGLLENAGGAYMVSAAAGFVGGGPLGAAAGLVAPAVIKKIGDVIFRRMAKAGAESATRSSDAISAFLTVGKKIKSVVPPLATRVLSSVAFAPEVKTVAAAPLAKASPLLDTFRQRAAEIRSQTTGGPDGRAVMTPSARAALAARLDGIGAMSPLLADKLETIAARRIEFLADKLPKRPDLGMQIGPDRWQPSEMAVRTWARYVAAVEDPGAVEERLIHGTVTPEDAEAYRTVYPDRFEDFRLQLIERLPELQASLPYPRRLALSIFSGIAVDPAMDPKILRVLQGMFDAEPGTDGGTSAPTAQPAFGSISKEALPEPTAAQNRAG